MHLPTVRAEEDTLTESEEELPKKAMPKKPDLSHHAPKLAQRVCGYPRDQILKAILERSDGECKCRSKQREGLPCAHLANLC